MSNFFSSIFFFILCISQGSAQIVFENDELKIEQISKHAYRHISFLDTKEYGKVASNGVLYLNNNEALVYDTPVNDHAASYLIGWIEKHQKSKIKAVVVTHFHEDCLGGLEEFHKNGIPSYSTTLTKELAQKNNYSVPQNIFTKSLEIHIGGITTATEFLGAGHTLDNAVGFIPSEKVFFGGCLVKAAGSGKGNLADADVGEWAETVKRIKLRFPDVKVVVPGHGSPGGPELLDYTIELFRNP
ncbi:metallo-beta-lactamase class B [Salinimicrobium sediminis]|uniref:beta-lactamase n=1 Tax=Salinimicrobium sediminis TaxID=1343891 RepID=A0A285X3G3_9FLAO|nr:subclass B1 metallo-beta-lactamase [Salinimicrobium sediminis]SOC79546.1 metallo-beta-lactamase class B [Salinimicrobium sediminis]